MPFNWNEYIELGRELKDEAEPAKLRTSVSRGYYGVYHKSKIRLGHTTNEYIKHERVINELRQNGEIENNIRLANSLQNLKEDREKADYKAFENVDQRFSNMFWDRLERYLNLLDPPEED